MLDLLQSVSALPNLHPAVIHFPIALALLVPLLRALHLLLPDRDLLSESATWSAALAALGGVAAWLAGRAAVATLPPLAPRVENALVEHAEWGESAVWVLVVAALLAFAADRFIPREHKSTALRTGLLLVGLIAAGVVGLTADLGGALVYRHGVAVAASANALASGVDGTNPPAPPAATPSISAAVAPPPATAPPVPAIPSIAADLLSSAGSTPLPIGPDGVLLSGNGPRMLLLPGTRGDVTVEARLDPTRFHGRFALVHHVGGLDTWEGFRLDPSAGAALVRVENGKEKLLASKPLEIPARPITLNAAVAAGHLKGYVDGEMAVHGHGHSGAPGRVGVFFEGNGTLRLLELTVRDATGEH